MLLGARIYDPAVGRFLSPDPVLQLINPYTYTLGNPVWFSDPEGTDSFDTGVAVGAGAAPAAEVAGAVASGGALTPIGAAALGFSLGLGGLLLAIAIYIAIKNSSLGGGSNQRQLELFRFPPPLQHQSPGIPSVGSCAPTALGATPNLGPLLWVLVPIQMLLGWLLLARRLSPRTRRR